MLQRKYRLDNGVTKLIILALPLFICSYSLGGQSNEVVVQECADKGPFERSEQEEKVTANKKTIQSFFDNFNENKISDAFALVSEDVKWWVPGTLPFSGTKTKAEYLGIVKRIQEGFPQGFKLNVTHMIGEETMVAAEVESLGKHANGMTYNNKYHFLFTIGNDGKIIAVKEYMDTQHLANILAGPHR